MNIRRLPYVDLEVKITELKAQDVITASGQEIGSEGPNEQQDFFS